jgi:hypothetical protein
MVQGEVSAHDKRGAMFIIFGWGRRTIRTLGNAASRLCPNCHNESQWVVVQVRRWFTLFFIPVIPYQTMHLALCPVCSRGIEVDAEAAQHLAQGGAWPAGVGPAQGAPPPPPPPIQATRAVPPTLSEGRHVG